jgi:Flp pilus assembly protein TadD
MNPDHSKLLRKAQALTLSGNALEAATAFLYFLNLEPNHAPAWADYAGQLMGLGNLGEAERACQSALAIDPQNLSARINLGCIMMRRDCLDEAERQFRTVLAVDERRMDAHLSLVECLFKQRDLGNIRKLLHGAIQPGAMGERYSVLKVQHAELWARFGLALLEVRQFREAEDACHTALWIDPDNFHAKAHLGSIQMAQGHSEAAEALFQRLVATHPHEESARLLWITSLAIKGDLNSTLREIAGVLQSSPNSFTVHTSVIGTCYSHGLWTEFQAEIQRYRNVSPASAYVDFEQSFVDLLFGDLLQGWERYEARLRIPPEQRPNRSFAQPAWKGEPFVGKTLLLWAEQGLGDTLMFIRYLPLVKALGGRVILETQTALVEVAATCQGADLVLPRESLLPPFDLQVSLMSLPWVFRTELASIPAEIPYLAVPQEVPNRQRILELLALTQDSTRIGLVWAGSPGHVRDDERSLPATALAPLAALPGVAWFSFQLGNKEVPPLPNLHSLAPLLQDFADTAYALSGMDLVITVDTAVAHLAGALGIPTLLLLAFQPDYRWLLERDDSPWYPTLRLYRQPAYGDWASVIRQLASDLTQDS